MLKLLKATCNEERGIEMQYQEAREKAQKNYEY